MKFHDLLNGQTSAADTAAPSATTVHNLIILDASGSMGLIYNQALTGLNETLQTIRQAAVDNPEIKQSVTLMSFSTSGFNFIYSNTEASGAADITSDRYRPNGGTPLYDAIGKGIGNIDAIKAAGESVLVTIITDGEENCSREFSGRQVKALIERKRGQGWVFTYIGANQDVERVAADLAITHSMAFEASAEGTRAMWNRQNNSRMNFYSKLKDKITHCADATADDEDFSF